MQPSFTPTLDLDLARRRLSALLVDEPPYDPLLDRRIDRLQEAFRSFADSFPLPLWAPGLAVEHEMRSLSEALFPVAWTRALFDRVLKRGCRFVPLLHYTSLHTAPSWPDLLGKLWPQASAADPAPLLRELVACPDRRRDFLFALFLPQHYGAGFDRYPVQLRWLSGWLRENCVRLGGGLRLLDSACGSGEGTYRLAELLLEAGYVGERCEVHGSTVEQFELFAAAHLFFPHDPKRQLACRGRAATLLESPGAPRIEFYLDDVGVCGTRGGYDVVLCNGLLGGPLLHEPKELNAAIGGLAARLAPGGLLLAADKFHAGWRLRVPEALLLASLERHGLTPLVVPMGIAGVKEHYPPSPGGRVYRLGTWVTLVRGHR
jgi:hypothetical protein